MITPLFRRIAFTFTLLATGLITGSVDAQMNTDEDDMQRCVWQCLYHNPGASNPRYQACVAQMCEETSPPPSVAPAKPTPVQPVAKMRWKYGSAQSGEHFAGIDVSGGSLTYLCRPDGTALVGVGGIGGSGAGAELRVDGKATGLRFTPRGSALFSDLQVGASLPRVLMTGRAAEVRDRATGRALSFPLAGSGAAIAQAMQGCGIAR